MIRGLILFSFAVGLIALILRDSGESIHEDIVHVKKEERTIRFLTWEGYFPKSVYDSLERETGIKVEETTFATNKEFFDMIESGKQFDVALPTDYMALRMDQLGYTERIDYRDTNVTEIITPKFIKHKRLQPLFECSVPFIFGSLSLGYNRLYFDQIPLTLKYFFEDESIARMKGHVAINDDMRNVLGLILKYLGTNPNSTDKEEIEYAGEYLQKFMNRTLPFMAGYGIGRQLAEGEVYIGMAWGGEISYAMEGNTCPDPDPELCLQGKSEICKGKPSDHFAGNPALRFVSADEGVLFFFECFTIMKGCEDRETAEEFIKFMFEPKVSAEITNTSHYATVNDAAKPYVRREILNGPSYFIPSAGQIFIRREIEDAESLYQEVWDKIETHYEDKIIDKRNKEVIF